MTGLLPARATRRLASAALLAAPLLAGCGEAPIPPPPPEVPMELVPASLQPNLGIEEYTEARKTFAGAGSASLVADGRLWQIRRGAQLLGTLQISTVRPEVSVANADDRKDILDSIMTGSAYENIDVHGVAVAEASSADKTLYVWFGAKMFQVLQLKGSKVDPDEVVSSLIAHQQQTGKLQAVGSVDEEDFEGG